MNVGDKVCFLEAMLYMREHSSAVFEDEKAQYAISNGRLWQQHRSDREPFNYGGDWHGSSGWSSWTTPQILSTEKKYICTKV